MSCIANIFHVCMMSISLFRQLLQKSMVDGLLAPDIEQRVRYKRWLYVYAKDKTSLPPRMAQILDTYEVSCKILFGCLAHLLGIWRIC